MNIYRVIEADTGKFVFEGNTEQIMEKYYISRDLLSYICKKKENYAGLNIIKIGKDGRGGRKKKVIPKGTEFNKGLDEDVAKANELGLSYGEYKNIYYWGA